MGDVELRGLTLGPCEVDLDALVVRWSDREDQPLTSLEAALLRYLVAARGRVVSQEEALTEVWGYRAGVRSRAASLLVGRLRKKIEVDASAPRYLLTAYGAGFRLDLSGGSDAALPGREEESAALRAWWSGDGRVLAITGPGGVGKSRLVRDVLGEEVPLVELEGLRAEAELLRAVLSTLGESSAPEGQAEEAVCTALARLDPPLLVLDGADALAEALNAPLARFLLRCPRLRVVVTSRMRLGLPGALVLRVAPLTLDAARALWRSQLHTRGASEALDEAAERALLERLDGLPLAIELAAARAASLGVAQLAARLHDAGELMREGSGGPGAGRGLRSVFEAAWETLDGSARGLLIALSVFEGGFSRESALRVATAALGLAGLNEGFDRLVDGSLVLALPERPARWRLLDAARQFVVERRTGEQGRQAAIAAHGAHYLALGERALLGLDGVQAKEFVLGLARERQNLRAAWRASGEAGARARLAVVLGELSLRLGQSADAELEEEAGQLGAEIDPAVSVRVSVLAGRLAAARGAHELAAIRLDQARRVIDALPPGPERLQRGLAVEAGWWIATAELSVLRGRYAEGVRSGQQALTLSRAAGDREGQGSACQQIAAALRRRGSYESALQYAKDAVEHLRSGSNLRLLARAHGDLGAIQYELGRLDEAAASYHEANVRFRALGSSLEHARCQLNAAQLAIARRDLEEAERLIAEALEAHERVGDALGTSTAWYATARLRIEQARLPDADDALARARHLAEQLGLARQGAAARLLQGWLHHRTGKPRKAELAYQEAASALRALDARGELGLCLLWWSLLCHREQAIARADELQDEAMSLLDAVGSPLGPLAEGHDDSELLTSSFQARRTWDLVELARSAAHDTEDPVLRARRRHGRDGFLRSVLPLRRTVS